MKPSKTRYAAVLALALWASPVTASEYADRIILWLEEQGFTHFEVERTWLGRIKIEAHASGIEREIVINGRTGEILRDYWEIEDGNGANASISPLAVPEDMGNTRHVVPVQSEDDENEDDHPEDDEMSEESEDSDDDRDDDEDEDDEEDEDEDEDDEDEEDDEDDEDDDDEKDDD